MARPVVNLDAIAAIFDRVLSHPVAKVAAELLPQTAGAVRAARDDLPALASGLEARAVGHVKSEVAALERELVEGVTVWIQDTIRAGRGESRPRQLRAPRAAAKRSKKAKKR